MKPIKILLLIAATCCGSNSAFAQTWTQTSAPTTNWTAVACSADGTKLVAVGNGGVGPGYIIAPGPIYLSTNSGADWMQATNAPALAWQSVASSADGNKLTAAADGDGIYRSVDGGLTWTATSATKANWVSVASSADGNKLASLARVFPPPDFYTSSDSGNSWLAKDSPYDRWLAMASSADGNTLVACGPGTVLVSTNSGSSWTTNFIGNGSLSAVASSADGSRLLLAGSSGIYLSINSGLTWTQINAPGAGHIASSANGSKLVATGWVGYNTIFPVHVSTDCGVTWTTNVPSGTNYWTSVVSSADGSKLAATARGPGGVGGGIWTAQTTPTPSMNIHPTSGSLKLSWIVPSTNFVMQQSSDLQNWADMTNQPALNLTNLQNEVILALPGSNVFYRLKTP
jgi:hypothetical protein